MQTLFFDRMRVNFGALDEQLRAELGEACYGISTQKGALLVFLRDGSDDTVRQRAENIVRAHDPAQLSIRQQETAQRQANLQKLRETNATPLDPKTLPTTDPLMTLLLARVQWLEAELRDLRG
jgi:hypothetical protein